MTTKKETPKNGWNENNTLFYINDVAWGIVLAPINKHEWQVKTLIVPAEYPQNIETKKEEK